MKRSISKILLSLISAATLLLNTFAPLAYAQENTSTPTPTPTQAATESPSPTPTVSATPSSSPETQTGNVDASTGQNTNNNEDTSNLPGNDLTNQEGGSAQIVPSVTTDKADYSPTEKVTLTGNDFPVNSDLTVKVTWPDGVVRNSAGEKDQTDQVTTDDNGSFVFFYDLRGQGQGGTYQVSILMGTSVLASTTFTDSPGAIWTTDATCGGTDLNLYANKGDVYLNGGPSGGGGGLEDGNYFVQVTEPDGTLLGKTNSAVVIVSGGEIASCYKLVDIVYTESSGYTDPGYDTSTNGGGEYKVWLSKDSSFPNKSSKTDNFKVNKDEASGELGSITVCKVIQNPQGEIVNGSEVSGAEFSITGFTPKPETSEGAPAGEIGQTNFTTPTDLNSDILGNDQQNDANCVTYGNLKLGSYYYSQETLPSTGWEDPKYNDGYTLGADSLSNFFPYSNELFDQNPNTDDSRNKNSDGNIVLSSKRPDRTLVVLNQYKEPESPSYQCSQTVYAANNDSGFYWVDKTNGQVHNLSTLDFGSSASADDPFNNRTYYAERYGSIDRLAYFDHDNSSNNVVGNLNVPSFFTKLAFNVYGELDGLTDDHTLYKIDTTTPPSATSLGTISGIATGGDIVFDENNTLYLIGTDGRFYTVDTSTLVASLVKNTGLSKVTGLAYDGTDFFVSVATDNSTQSSIYKMDKDGNTNLLSTEQSAINDLSSCLPGQEKPPDIPRYEGGNQCSEGTVPVKLGSYSISSTDPDGETINLTANQEYLFKASGTFSPTSVAGYLSDAGYTLYNGSLATQYGINGTAPDLGAHALLANLGLGVGIVDWGSYDSSHEYNFAYTPTNSSQQFVIGDRYDHWFNTDWDDQAGMIDNEGSLNLDVYKCVEEGTIQGTKYYDTNANGLHDYNKAKFSPYEDNLLNGWNIRLYDENWNFVQETTTASLGNKGQYRFHVAPGVYNVCEVMQDGWVQTGPISGAKSVNNNHSPTGNGVAVDNQSPNAKEEGSVCWNTELKPGVTDGWLKFGNINKGSIEGMKYEDINGNGKKDEEPGLEGWTINLYQGETWLRSETTDKDGNYKFADVLGGEYKVCEQNQTGYINTDPGNYCKDISVNPGQDLENINFGNQQLNPGLSLTKSNDATGALSTGDTVTYTLVVTNTGNQDLTNVQIKDALPGGFSYVDGSSTLDGGSVSDPAENSGALTWTVGDLGIEKSKTLEYQASVDSDVAAGKYTNLAVATGVYGEPQVFSFLKVLDFINNNEEQEVQSQVVESDPLADSTVEVAANVNPSQSVNGQVLGASTELLPASGNPTNVIFGLIALMALGGVLKITALSLEKRNNKHV